MPVSVSGPSETPSDGAAARIPTPRPALATSSGMAQVPTLAERVVEPPVASVTVTSTSWGLVADAANDAVQPPDVPEVAPETAASAHAPPTARWRHVMALALLDGSVVASTDHVHEARQNSPEGSSSVAVADATRCAESESAGAV